MKFIFRWIPIVIAIAVETVTSYPLKSDETRSHHNKKNSQIGHDEAKDYLVHYGYLQSNFTWPQKTVKNNAYTEALKNFQRFYKLNVNGILTDKTKSIMEKPRCGNPDDYTIISNSSYNTNSTYDRHKRYAFIVNTTKHFGLRFKSKVISYKIYNYTNKLSMEVVDKEIARVFNVWAKLSNKTFRQIKDNSGKDCIRIVFIGKKSHIHDGVLAYTYRPRSIVPVYILDHWDWTVDSPHGQNLFQVLAHEIGHTLGLAHSDVSTALMFPYIEYLPHFELDEDDVRGIQELYKEKKPKRK